MAYAIRFSRVVLLLILAVVLAAGALIFANGSSSDNVPPRDLAGNALAVDARVAPVGSEHPSFPQSAAVDLVRERYLGVDIYKTSLISFTALSTHDVRLAWAVLIDPASADKLIACDNRRVCPSPGPGYVTVVVDAQTGQVLIVAGAVAA
jgi:hypothetical protein